MHAVFAELARDVCHGDWRRAEAVKRRAVGWEQSSRTGTALVPLHRGEGSDLCCNGKGMREAVITGQSQVGSGQLRFWSPFCTGK